MFCHGNNTLATCHAKGNSVIFYFVNYGNNTLATCHAKDNSVIFYFENYIVCIEIEMWDVGGGFAMAKAPLIFVMVKATLGIFSKMYVSLW